MEGQHRENGDGTEAVDVTPILRMAEGRGIHAAGAVVYVLSTLGGPEYAAGLAAGGRYRLIAMSARRLHFVTFPRRLSFNRSVRMPAPAIDKATIDRGLAPG